MQITADLEIPTGDSGDSAMLTIQTSMIDDAINHCCCVVK